MYIHNDTQSSGEIPAYSVRPHHSEPGSLLEQMRIVVLTLRDPDHDRNRAFQRSRRRVLPHARRQAG